MKATNIKAVAAATLLVIIGTPQAIAMTEKDAANNLVLFATAMKEAELCEGLGHPSRELVRKWEKRNSDVFMQSMQRIEQHALQSGTVNAEGAHDVAIGFFIRAKERFDREVARTRGPQTCAHFSESLTQYQQRFVK